MSQRDIDRYLLALDEPKRSTLEALRHVRSRAERVPSGQYVRVDEPENVVEQLLARCRRDHALWINGDPSGYVLPEDGTLMGALGGSTRGGGFTANLQGKANSMWESGSGEVELVAGGVRDGIAWLVMIERGSVKFVGRDTPTRWDLRVTELFRKNGDDWERFHRHADPVVDGHQLDDLLPLLA